MTGLQPDLQQRTPPQGDPAASLAAPGSESHSWCGEPMFVRGERSLCRLRPGHEGACQAARDLLWPVPEHILVIQGRT